MKKLLAILMVLMMTVGMLAACKAPAATDNGTEAEAASNELNLMDMYTIQDPEGVEYDQRTALYAPTLESDENYARGVRHTFVVFYGKDGKGVYMYEVTVCDTPENAEAYKTLVDADKVDGNVVIVTSDAAFFTAMESFIPDLKTWIDNMSASGLMPLE